MNNITILEHANGAPGLRFFGLGPSLKPSKGLKQVQTLLTKNSSWGKKRNLKDIKKMLARSSVVVSIWSNEKLIGFGRATTDEIFRAVLWDVVVEKNYQNSGLGKKIVQKILMNPLISKVERIYIMTTHCEVFYDKIGFKIPTNQKLMIYKNNKKSYKI